MSTGSAAVTGKQASTVAATWLNQAARCLGVLAITTQKVCRTTFLTPQNSKIHCFQSRSSGSPNTSISRSGGCSRC